MKRIRARFIVLAIAVLSIFGGFFTNIAIAPAAHAAQVVGSVNVYKNLTTKVATVQVEWDQSANKLVAYTFHYGETNLQVRRTTIHICYIEYNRGPCYGSPSQPGHDDGWYQAWAGPVSPSQPAGWPSPATAIPINGESDPTLSHGYRPWRAEGMICHQNMWHKAWIEGDWDQYPNYADRWGSEAAVAPC